MDVVALPFQGGGSVVVREPRASAHAPLPWAVTLRPFRPKKGIPDKDVNFLIKKRRESVSFAGALKTMNSGEESKMGSLSVRNNAHSIERRHLINMNSVNSGKACPLTQGKKMEIFEHIKASLNRIANMRDDAGTETDCRSLLP